VHDGPLRDAGRKMSAMSIVVSEQSSRIAELEAIIGRLWDVAQVVTVDGEIGCFVPENEWRRLVVDPAHNR
jgi:hypothetical protein